MSMFEATHLIGRTGQHFTAPRLRLSKQHRTVLLIGAVHIGMIEYYNDMQSFIDTAEHKGYVVTHEGVDWSNIENGYGHLSASEVKELQPYFERIRVALESVGIAEQIVRIHPRKSWHFIDPYLFDAVKDVPTLQFERIKAGFESCIENPQAVFINIRDWVENMERAGSVPTTRLLREKRDLEAGKAILALLKTNNVLSCWGVNHLPGIVAALECGGFKVDETVWRAFMPVTL